MSCPGRSAGTATTAASRPGSRVPASPPTTGAALTAEQVAAGAQAGDEKCAATLARYEDRLARALAAVINLIDPGVIVLGGGVSGIGRLYDNVPRLWDAWIFSDRVDTKLVPPAHGDASGVRGAAWLWPEG